MKVFVTDAAYKHSLAIIRAISSKYAVDCGDPRPYALSFFSSRTQGKLLYPDPRHFPRQFAETIVQLARKSDYAAVLPVGYESCVSLVRFAPNFDRVLLPTVEAMEVASNKSRTTDLAKSLDISIPKTIQVSDSETLNAAGKILGFPFFLKNSLGSGQNALIRSESELRDKGRFLLSQGGGNFIAQEVVIGDGYGFFGLFNRGSLRAFFMHKRIRESFREGGASTCAESIYDSKLKDYGTRILQALKWNGVAMVEFKRTTDNEYKLLEINPKFWGSLDLAIAAGVDFPQLMIQCITMGDCPVVSQYVKHLRYQWPIPDDFARLGWGMSEMRPMVEDLANREVRKNLTIHDPGPALIQFVQLGYLITRNLRDKNRAK